MRRMLYELVTKFAAATGCRCEAEEGGCRASIDVEGLVVHIGLLEEAGMMLFQTAVASLPAAGAGREELCMKLLAADNLFSGTRGFTLGLDAAQEIVTMQLAWDAQQLDDEAFSHIVNNLVSVALEWTIRLDEWRPSSAGDKDGQAGDDSFMMHFLKV